MEKGGGGKSSKGPPMPMSMGGGGLPDLNFNNGSAFQSQGSVSTWSSKSTVKKFKKMNKIFFVVIIIYTFC